MITVTKFKTRFFCPNPRKGVRMASEKNNSTRSFEREDAAFPFTMNTMNNLARVFRLILTLKKIRYTRMTGDHLSRRSKRAVPTANRKKREKVRPSIAEAADGYTENRQLMTSSAYVCAMQGVAKTNKKP
jgi:hypothetical protein